MLGPSEYTFLLKISDFKFTLLEIPSIYCQTIKDYAMRPLYRNLTDALKIASGEKLSKESFDKYEEIVDFRIENE